MFPQRGASAIHWFGLAEHGLWHCPLVATFGDYAVGAGLVSRCRVERISNQAIRRVENLALCADQGTDPSFTTPDITGAAATSRFRRRAALRREPACHGQPTGLES